MRRAQPWLLVAVLLSAPPLVGGCGRGESPAEEPADQGGEAVEGLSREEIRLQAEAMSPEQAEQLGIVDSTIHVETLTNPSDSALLSDTLQLPAPDTAS